MDDPTAPSPDAASTPAVDYDKIFNCLALLKPDLSTVVQYTLAVAALEQRERAVWLGLFGAHTGPLYVLRPHVELLKRLMKADPADDAQNMREMASLDQLATNAVRIVVAYLTAHN